MLNVIKDRLLLVGLGLALPWQTHWALTERTLYGQPSAFGHVWVYGVDVLMLVALWGLWSPSVRMDWTDRWRQPVWRRVLLGIGALMAWMWLGALWSVDPLLTLGQAARVTMMVGMVAVVRARSVADRVMLVSAIGVGWFVPSLMAWMQTVHQFVEASSWLGIAAQDPRVAGTAVVEWSGGRWLRAYGSMPHPNSFGGMLALALVSMVALLPRIKTRGSELLMTLCAVIMTAALVMTASRGAWIAFLVGGGVLAAVWGRQKNQHAWRRVSMMVGLMLAVGGVVLWSLGPILLNRVSSQNRLEQQSVSVRAAQWDEWSRVMRDPAWALLGTGAGAYVFALTDVKPLQQAWAYQPVHNVMALVIAEVGVVGVGLLLWAVIPVVREGIRRRGRTPDEAWAFVACVSVLMSVDHYLWTQPTGVYTAVLLGAAFLTGHENS